MGKLALGSTFIAEENRVVTVMGSALPVVLPANGTVATAGTITIGVALPQIYANCWIYLPAAAVVNGLAGIYFAKMTSTTEGQIYADYVSVTATPFVPHIPSGTLTAAVGSNSAYTTLTSAAFLAHVVIPGNLMGANGEAVFSGALATINNANAKSVVGTFGAMTYLTASAASVLTSSFKRVVTNRNSASLQVSNGLAALADTGTNTTANIIGTVNSGNDVACKLSVALAVPATDFAVLEYFQVRSTDA